MYKRLLDILRGRGEGDSVHAASVIAVEFQSIVAIVLLVFLAARWVSIYAAILVVAVIILTLRGRILTFDVFCENDDRIQTLLFYMISTLALTIVLVGWFK